MIPATADRQSCLRHLPNVSVYIVTLVSPGDSGVTANAPCWSNNDLMLASGFRLWPNIKTTFNEYPANYTSIIMEVMARRSREA